MVYVDRVEEMNLLGLILQGLLWRNLRVPRNARRIARARGDVLVRAGRMRVTLRLRDGDVWILRGEQGRPDARAEGALSDLMDVALRRRLVRLLVTRRLRVGGRLTLLLRLMPLLRA